MREQDIRHVPSNAWGALATKLVELSRSLLGRHLARVRPRVDWPTVDCPIRHEINTAMLRHDGGVK